MQVYTLRAQDQYRIETYRRQERNNWLYSAVEGLDARVNFDVIKRQLEPEEAKELKKLRKRWLKLPNQLEVDALIARAEIYMGCHPVLANNTNYFDSSSSNPLACFKSAVSNPSVNHS